MILNSEDLKHLSACSLNNLIKEYLLMQLEDGRLEDYTKSAFEQGIKHVKTQLEEGSLVVEYSELHESITIKEPPESF